MKGIGVLLCLILFEMFMIPLTLFTFSPPPNVNIPNPMCDILPSYCTGTGIGSGTLANPLNQTNVQQQQTQTNCGIGGLLGGIAGGVIGFLGGNLAGGLLGFGFGFTGGCGTAVAGGGIVSPYFNSFLSSLTSSFGPLGDFVHSTLIAIGYFSTLLIFGGHLIAYEGWLFVAYPELGFFLLPIQGLTIIVIMLYIMEYLRGAAGAIGAGAAAG